MIYVMSDIHGNMSRFTSILTQINLQQEDTLYILGDVIDRGAHGIEILQKVMKTPNIKMLLGNHEYMMLNCVDENYRTYSKARSLWMRNGGQVTLDAFNNLQPAEQQEIIDYLEVLPINIDIEVNNTKYKLVHAHSLDYFPQFGRYYYSDEIEFAVWERIKYELPKSDYVVIFGHTPTIHYQNSTPLSIWKHENGQMIGIDCGCAYTSQGEVGEKLGGRLGCLCLDEMKEYYA